jgi:succinate dehydrogenase/fumarate reductase flavoprotein subunit
MGESKFVRACFDIVTTDILVMGGGLAGCIAAVKASSEEGPRVALVDKGYVGKSGSSVFAAGVINVCTPEDDQDLWIKEIVMRGEYLNDQQWVKILLEETFPLVMEMDRWGQKISGKPILKRDSKGNLQRLRGRGQEFTRVCMLDALTMMETLAQKVKHSAVNLFNRVMITDLLVNKGRILGAVGLDYRNNKIIVFVCKALIMAASGCGFKSFFIGHKNLTGEAHKAAYENGAILRNFDQANSNTTAKLADVHGLNLMIGFGGRFINAKGEEFMSRYDPHLGNFASMPTLGLSFCLENESGRGPVYLDLSAVSLGNREVIRNLIPEGIAVLESIGLDPFAEPIEWIPAFFGSIAQGGGVHIDSTCSSNIDGLFVAGDSSCSPIQGTASVGGLNLAFCLVSGERAARHALKYIKEIGPAETLSDVEGQLLSAMKKIKQPLRNSTGYTPGEVIKKVQDIMLRGDVAYLADEASLIKALHQLAEVKNTISSLIASDSHELVKAMEICSMLTVGEMIIRSKLFRHESRGFSYRKDFPFTDNQNWLKWVMVRKDSSNEEMQVYADVFPTPYVKPPVESYPRFPVRH